MSSLFTIPAGRRAKWVVLAVFLLLSVPVAALSGKFEGAQKNETASFLPGDAESIKALDVVEKYPGVFARDGGLTAADKQRISSTVTKLNQNRPELVLEAQPPVFSEDGQAAIITQPVQPGDGQGDKFQNAAHQPGIENVVIELDGSP